MQVVSFSKNGVYVNGNRIDNVKNFKLETDEHNVSKITMTFYAETEGLDNQKPKDTYSFKSDAESSLFKEVINRQFDQIKGTVSKNMKGGE